MTRRARPADQAALLLEVLGRARDAGPAGVVVFDLDSTLLDNRPRQARILQDYGRLAALPALLDARPEHWDGGWSLEAAMARAGLAPDEIAAHRAPARRFWADWFFTSTYCRLDVPIPGAPEFTRAVAAAGARVAYVTGRPPAMETGTRDVLARHGFPFPDGRGAHLLMKPSAAQHDDEWKAQACARVEALGRVVAAFDNEPAHANAYARAWPAARVVHLDTDHSPRPIDVRADIPSVADFRLLRAIEPATEQAGAVG